MPSSSVPSGEKIRIGFGIGAVPALLSDAGGLGRVIDDLDALGFDSVWFPERINNPQLDPIVAMAFVAGRVEHLKFGPAVSVVPGRNPVVLAKAMASLDAVSEGRCLPAFGLGIANAAEQQAFQVDRSERAPWLNEALPLMRRLWTGEIVEHHGERFSINGARVLPTPVQDPFEVWLGGQAPSELRRTGRLGDGWLASFTTPRHVTAGIDAIKAAAADAGRTIDEGHYGVLIPYVDGAIPDPLARRVQQRRPDEDPAAVVATSHLRLTEMIDEFISVGASKFVAFRVGEPSNWSTELRSLAEAVLPRQI